MRHGANYGQTNSFHIVNVTSEVIRDYLEESAQLDVSLPHAARQHAASAPELRTLTRQSTNEGQEASIPRPNPPTPAPLPDLLNANGLSFLSPQLSDSTLEDGIFLPGSQYQELHAQLRSRIIDTARSTVPSRLGSPVTDHAAVDSAIQSELPDSGGDDYEVSATTRR